MVKIEKITHHQVFEIEKMAAEIWPHTFHDILSSDQISYMLDLFYSPSNIRKQILQNQLFFIAYLNSEKAAFFSSELHPNHLKLHKLYVHPTFQSKGVGQSILDYCVKTAHKYKLNLIRLNVNRYNKKAIDFYKKNNFYIDGQEDINIGSGFFMEDFIMKRTIQKVMD